MLRQRKKTKKTHRHVVGVLRGVYSGREVLPVLEELSVLLPIVLRGAPALGLESEPAPAPSGRGVHLVQR